jgi:hypothetical protein
MIVIVNRDLDKASPLFDFLLLYRRLRMPQRLICKNVQHLFKTSRTSPRVSFNSPQRSFTTSSESRYLLQTMHRTRLMPYISEIANPSNARGLSSPKISRLAPGHPAPLPTYSNRHSFSTSSRVKGWAPARTLQRKHPAAPTESQEVIEHLRRVFPPLEFPEDVALRIITHVSWKGGAEGHNARLSFIGT